MLLSFPGGIHVPHTKNTSKCSIEEFPAPEYVYIPLQQHIGAPAKAIVAKGDTVKAGQIIAKFDDALCCPVHASVSGTVEAIELRNSYTGYGKVEHIVIKNDCQNTLSEECVPFSGDLSDATSDDIIAIVKKAGISGMGGATFPTYAKISSAIGKAKDMIVNCAECEPFITANHRLMLENTQDIIKGIRVLLKATGVEKATVAIEDNKSDAIEAFKKLTAGCNDIIVKVMKTKYPQGDERQLMKAIFNRELPPGKLPADIGCVIFNAETCHAVYNAFYNGMPLIKRVVTIDGDCINQHKNIRVPLGTSYEDIVEYCGGLKTSPEKVISGGPMMGMAQWDMRSVVMKGTSAILFLSDKFTKKTEPNCIHCGKCVSVCPMRLVPTYFAMFGKARDYDSAEKYDVMSCVECGSCTFTCPGNVPIVQYIRNAKTHIIAKRKKAQSK